MLKLRFFFLCVFSPLAWTGCAALTSRSRCGEGLFGVPFTPGEDHDYLWWFLAGAILGAAFAFSARWILSRWRAGVGGSLVEPMELIKLEAALNTVDQLVHSWKREGVVVILDVEMSRRRGKKI